MELTDFTALSFDCYGTLIDWETGLLAVLRPWADRNGLQLGDDALLAAYADQEAAAEAEHPDWLYPQILAEALRGTGAVLDVTVEAAEADHIAGSVGDWPAFADSAAALQRLAERFRLIILSNVDRASFAASNRVLGVTFDAVLTAQDIGSYKPAPQNFQALIEQARSLGVADGRLLHVAQSLFHDHVPAHEIGLPTVWINRRNDRPGWGATPAPPTATAPDWEFATLAEFADAATSAPSAPSAPSRPPRADPPLS